MSIDVYTAWPFFFIILSNDLKTNNVLLFYKNRHLVDTQESLTFSSQFFCLGSLHSVDPKLPWHVPVQTY